jgi:hypothetical protein
MGSKNGVIRLTYIDKWGNYRGYEQNSAGTGYLHSTVEFDGDADLFDERATISSPSWEVSVVSWVDPSGSAIRILGYDVDAGSVLYFKEFMDYEATEFKSNPAFSYYSSTSDTFFLSGSAYITADASYYGFMYAFDPTDITTEKSSLSFTSDDGYSITALHETSSNIAYMGLSMLNSGYHSYKGSVGSAVVCFDISADSVNWMY